MCSLRLFQDKNDYRFGGKFNIANSLWYFLAAGQQHERNTNAFETSRYFDSYDESQNTPAFAARNGEFRIN